MKKLLVSGLLCAGVLFGSTALVNAQNITYKVQPGDTFYLISQRYGVSLDNLIKANNMTYQTILYPGQNLVIPSDSTITHTVVSGESYYSISKKYGVDFHTLLKANNATTSSMLNIGDKVKVPVSQTPVHTVQAGDTFYLISRKYNVKLSSLLAANNANENTILHIGQKVIIPQSTTSTSTSTPTANQSASQSTNQSTQPYVTYINYTVQKGDSAWTIADKYGVPVTEVQNANNLTSSTVLNIGQVLKIPVHHIPVKSTPGEQYGEYLDWWTEAQYVVPNGAIIEIVDFYTGKSFMAKRTTGANHADIEPLTYNDTQIMKEIWGGSFSWATRPVIVKYNGRKIAASASAMPHAGNDSVAGGVYTTWRSGNYSAGENLDWVKNNGADGVIDLHFLNSIRHKDGKVDPNHQNDIKIAAGLK